MEVVVSQTATQGTWNRKRLGSLQTAGYVSLVDAQHVRIMNKLHSMLESITEWRGPPTRSPAADLLRSELRPEERRPLVRWWKGEINGAQCMLELQRVGSLASRWPPAPSSSFLVDTLSLMVGLEAALSGRWLYSAVFAKPPQTVIKEALARLAAEATEDRPEELSIDQINLAFRKLVLDCVAPQEPACPVPIPPRGPPPHLPDARAAGQDESLGDPLKLHIDALTRTSPTPDAPPAAAAHVPAGPPGDEYLRLQVTMELLRLQAFGEDAPDQEDDPVGPGGEAEGGDTTAAIEQALLSPLQGAMEEAKAMSVERLQSDNGAVGPYTDYLKGLKRSLERRLKHLEEEGAYAILGLPASAPLEEVKRRYKAKALEAHPDKGGDAVAFQTLNQVYQLILRKRGDRADPSTPQNDPAAATAAKVLATVEADLKAARRHATEAAAAAQMALQWGKTMARLQSLAFPLAVPYFCSLVDMGAFRCALEVSPPTGRAARLVLDALTEAMQVVDCGIEYRLAGYTHGLLEEIRKGMDEAKQAGALAGEADTVNEGAADVLNMLTSSLELAQRDPEAHHLLVTVLTLRFQQLSDITQKCATQAMHALIVGCHVARLLRATMQDAGELRGQEDPRPDPPPTGEEGGGAAGEKEGPEGAAGRQDPEGRAEGDTSGEGEEDETDDSLQGLTRRMWRLQLQMRRQNAQLLQKLNADVLTLQTRLKEQLKGLCGLGDASSVSVPQKQHLFMTVAAFMDQACLDLEERAADGAAALPWAAALQRGLGWMVCLDRADRIAIFSDVRSQAFHLAALVDAGALRTMVEEEMMGRVEALLSPTDEPAAPTDESPAALLAGYRRRILHGLQAVLGNG